MLKERKFSKVKSISLFQIFLLISSFFAFSILSIESVGADKATFDLIKKDIINSVKNNQIIEIDSRLSFTDTGDKEGELTFSQKSELFNLLNKRKAELNIDNPAQPSQPPAIGNPTEAYRPISSATIDQAAKLKDAEEKLGIAIAENQIASDKYNKDMSKDNKNVLDASAKNVEKLQKEYDALKSAGGVAGATAIAPSVIPGLGQFTSPTGHLFAGLVYAGTVYGALEFIPKMFGAGESLITSLKYGVLSGVMTWQIFKAMWSSNWGGGKFFGKEGVIGQYAGPISVGIAIAVFLATYKKEKTEIVTFVSLPWQPPTGGRYCEECNKDPL